MKETSCIHASLAQVLQPLRGNNRPRQGFFVQGRKVGSFRQIEPQKILVATFCFQLCEPILV